MHGFVENKELKIDVIDKALHEPTDQRIFVISKAFRKGYTVDQIHDLTKIDKWFLYKLCHIIEIAEELEKLTSESIDFQKDKNSGFDELLKLAKQKGFSDFQIARAIWKDKMDEESQELFEATGKNWVLYRFEAD